MADERGFFESAEDATIDFLKAQIEPVRRIQQQKVEEVIGDSAARARIRRAESWRSNRSPAQSQIECSGTGKSVQWQ